MCRRYAAQNVLLVFGADADVHAVERRGLCLVLWDEYVTTTGSRSTAALFLPPQVLDTNGRDFSSRIYLPSATYLNLVNAELLVRAFLFFFRVVRVGKPFILLLRRY